MRKGLIFVLLVTLVAVVVVIYRFPRFKNKILSPIVGVSQVTILSDELERVGLLQSSPVLDVTNNRVTASVSGVLVIFPLQNDYEKEVRALQIILPEITMDLSKIKELDLRFDKPILRR